MPPPPDDQAIDTSVPIQPAGWGAFQTTPPPAPPARDLVGYLTDTALGVVQGAINIPAGLAGAATRIPDLGQQTYDKARENQNYLQDLSYWVGRAKTPAGQAEAAEGGPDITKDPMHALVQGAAGILPYAPVMMLGPGAPAVFGATGIGDLANRVSEKIRFADEHELMESPVYRQARAGGQTDQQARETLYRSTNDLVNNLIAGGSSAVGGGLLTSLTGKMGSKLLSKAIGDKIIHGWKGRLVAGGLEGFGAGAAMTGGQELATARSLYQAGLGPPPDLGHIAGEAAKSGATLGIIGGVGKLAFGQRPKADTLGADVDATARDMMADFAGMEPGRAMPPPPRPGLGMRPEDLGMPGPERHLGPMSEYEGPEYGPETARRAPPGMTAEDLGPGAGRLDVTPSMTAEDLGTAPPAGVATEGDLGLGSEYGPMLAGRAVPPRRGMRGMRQADIMSEYGPEITPPIPPYRGRRRPMEQGDIYSEYGPEGPARPPLRGGREMTTGDIMSEYGPEVPPRPPSPTGGGGGFGSRFARAEELRAARRRQMLPTDIMSEYGYETEPRGDVVLAGREMVPEDIYEPGGIEHGRAQAEEMLTRLEALKRRRDRMQRTGQTRGLDALDEQISALRRELIAHNRALAARRRGEEPPRPSEGESPPPRGGPPDEPPPPPPGGGPPAEPPAEPPTAEVHVFRQPDLDPRLIEHTTADLQDALRQAREAENEHVEGIRRANEAGDTEAAREHDRQAERMADVGDAIEHELEERARAPETAERRRQEMLAEQRDREAAARDQPEGVAGRGARETLEALGITPREPGVGEERVLPETANLPGRPTLGILATRGRRVRRRLEQLQARRTMAAGRGPTAKPFTVERRRVGVGPSGEAALAVSRRRVAREVEAGEGPEVQVRAERAPSMEAKTEVERREAERKEEEARREREAERAAGTDAAAKLLLDRMVVREGERQAENRRVMRMVRRFAKLWQKIEDFAKARITAHTEALKTGLAIENFLLPGERERTLSQQRRREIDAQRKQRVRNEQYNEREEVAKEALLNPDSLSIKALSDLVAKGFSQQWAEGIWGAFTPRGKRGERLLREGVEPAELPLRDQLDLFDQFINKVPHEHLRNIVRQIRDDVEGRIQAGVRGYEILAATWELRGLKSQIKLDVTDRRGRGSWHSQFASFQKFIDRVDAIIGKNTVDEAGQVHPSIGRLDTARTPAQIEKAYRDLRTLVGDYFYRHLMLERGRIAEIDKMDREGMKVAKDQFARAKRNKNLSATQREHAADMERLLDQRMLERWGEEEAPAEEGVGREPGEPTQDQEMADIMAAIDRAAHPEVARSERQVRQQNRQFRWLARWYHKSIESIPTSDILWRAKQVLDILMPGAERRDPISGRIIHEGWGSDYVNDAQRKAVENWIDDIQERNTIDADRRRAEDTQKSANLLAGMDRADQLERTVYGEQAVMLWNRYLTQRFGPRYHSLPEEFKQLSLDYGMLIEPRDLEHAVSPRQQAIKRTADANAIERGLRTGEHRGATLGDLYLPVQEQLEFIRRLQQGEATDVDVALRAQQLVDKASRLHNAMETIDPALWRDPERAWRSEENLLRLHEEMRERAGEPPDTFTENNPITPDVIIDDLKRWEIELRRVEHEARFHWEMMNPDSKHMEYGIGNVLDPAADLRRGDALPEGAYVTKVSDFAKQSPAYGLTTNRVVQHFLDVANRLVGDLDVVHLTDEQMNMAARERGLPVETPSFYDRPTDRILVRQSALQTADRNRLLIHEIAHPIMESASERDALHPVIRRLDEQRMALKDVFDNPQHPQHAEVQRLLGGDDHGLTNVHEFFSHLWSDRDFATALDAIKTTPAQRAKWKTGDRQTLLGAVLNDIRRGLTGMFNYSSSLVGKSNQERLLHDTTIASLDLLQRMSEGLRRRQPRFQPGEDQPLARAAREKERISEYGPAIPSRVPRGGGAREMRAGDIGLQEHPVREMVRGDIYPISPEEAHIGQYTGGEVKMTTGAAEVAAITRRLDLAIPGIKRDTDPSARPFQRLFEHLRKGIDLIAPLIKDAKVGVVPEGAWERGEHLGPAGRMGFYHSPTHATAYPTNASLATRVHELFHIATTRALYYHPEFNKPLQEIMDAVMLHPEYDKWMKEPSIVWSQSNKDYFLTNPREFLAEFGSNHEVRDLLERVPISKTTAHLLRINVPKKERNLMRATFAVIGRLLRGELRKADPRNAAQLTDRLLAEIFDAQRNLPELTQERWTELLTAQREREAQRDKELQALMEPMEFASTRGRRGRLAGAPSEGFVRDVWEGISERGKDIAAYVNQSGGITGLVIPLAPRADLARMADPGMQQRVLRVNNIDFERGHRQKEIMEKEDNKHIRALAREYRIRSPQQLDDILNYMDYENYVGASGRHRLGEGDNAWVGLDRDEPGNRQVHNEWDKLNRDWHNLPPESQDMIVALRDYYKKRYDDVRESTLRDILDVHQTVRDNHPEATDAMVKLVSEGRDALTPAEVDLLKAHVDGFDGYERKTADRTQANNLFRDHLGNLRIPEFRKIAGVYYPMMRRGDYVVEGHYLLDRFAQPFGGIERDRAAGANPSGKWEFEDPTKANGFIDRLSHDDAPFIKVNSVDKVTYETEGGRIKLDAQGNPVRGEEGEPNTTTRWIVNTNPLDLRFFPSLRRAQEAHDDLSRDPNMDLKTLQVNKDLYRGYMDPRHASSLIDDLIASTKRTAGYLNLDPTSREILSRQWQELGVRHLLSTSARSRYLPRTYAGGASKDALHNILQFANNTSHYLAELQLRPQLRAAVAEMDQYERDMRGSKDPEMQKWGLRRSQVVNEIHKRMLMRKDYQISPVWEKVMQTVLKFSFLDKLMSPGFLLLNASEPWTIAAPMLAGEHGVKAYAEVARAYNILGSGRVWNAGIGDFMKVLRAGIDGDPQLNDTIKLLTHKIKETGYRDKYSTPEELTQMLEHLQKHGYLDRNAGLELENALDPTAGRFTRSLNWVDNMFRQMNVQVENVNRGVTGISAYRLARMEGMSHEKAMEKAQDMVDKAAGNYGFINSPSIFNIPGLKWALQFKKYALRMTSNLLRVAFGAARNEPNARAQLIAMLASQQVMSGMLGMPTEPFKAMITATNQLGLNPYNTEDVERILNERLAHAVGRQGKDAILYGLPRLLGTGFGQRTGWDTLWTYGTLGNKRDDLATAIGHLAGGAPGGMLAEWLQGSKDMSHGIASYMHGARSQGMADITNGIHNLVPIKLIADAAPALQDYFTGRQKPSGQPFDYKPTMMDTVSRVAGVRTARDLSASQARGAFIRQRDVYNAERSRALQAYAQAGTPSERASVRDYILRQWNQGRPTVQQINIGDMQRASTAFERKSKLSPSDLGLTITKRTRPFAPNPDVWGFQPAGT